MELIIESIRAYYGGVVGCQCRNKDVMIAFTHEDEQVANMVHDLFLTNDQAKGLVESLLSAIEMNKLENINRENT